MSGPGFLITIRPRYGVDLVSTLIHAAIDIASVMSKEFECGIVITSDSPLKMNAECEFSYLSVVSVALSSYIVLQPI